MGWDSIGIKEGPWKMENLFTKRKTQLNMQVHAVEVNQASLSLTFTERGPCMRFKVAITLLVWELSIYDKGGNLGLLCCSSNSGHA